MSLGALILTGGASSRMGTDKALLDWGGVRAVDRLVALARELGADPVFTVGGPGYGHPHLEDDVRLGGPVGGILAGARALRFGCALILAVDSPTLSPTDLRPLLESPRPGAVFDGFPLPMTLNLTAIPIDAEASWPIRRLIATAGLNLLTPPLGAQARLKGANTPAEREVLDKDGPPISKLGPPAFR